MARVAQRSAPVLIVRKVKEITFKLNNKHAFFDLVNSAKFQPTRQGYKILSYYK